MCCSQCIKKNSRTNYLNCNKNNWTAKKWIIKHNLTVGPNKSFSVTKSDIVYRLKWKPHSLFHYTIKYVVYIFKTSLLLAGGAVRVAMASLFNLNTHTSLSLSFFLVLAELWLFCIPCFLRPRKLTPQAVGHVGLVGNPGLNTSSYCKNYISVSLFRCWLSGQQIGLHELREVEQGLREPWNCNNSYWSAVLETITGIYATSFGREPVTHEGTFSWIWIAQT